MSFHNVLFPTNISYGSRVGPKFNSRVTQLPSGATYAENQWDFPLQSYNVKYGIASHDDMQTLIDFVIGREGPVHSFKFKDPRDYASTSTGQTITEVIDEEDQLIGVGDASETQFQIYKTYSSGSQERNRNIQCIDQVLVAVDGVLQTETTHYSVDYSTGIITFVTAPGSGLDVTVGFTFHVKAKFGPEIDQQLEVVMENFDTETLPNILIMEDPDDTVVEDEYLYGGGTDHGDVAGGQVAITKAGGLVHVINPTSGVTVAQLPVIGSVQDGGPHFLIHHDGGAGSIDLKNNALSTTVVSVLAGSSRLIYKMGSNWYAV